MEEARGDAVEYTRGILNYEWPEHVREICLDEIKRLEKVESAAKAVVQSNMGLWCCCAVVVERADDPINIDKPCDSCVLLDLLGLWNYGHPGNNYNA